MANFQRSKCHFCIGYGGAPAIEPPGHTLASLRKALEIGASMLHVEVRATRDIELVAAISLQREHNGETVFLHDHALAEWLELTREHEHPILPLDEVLTLASRTRCGLLLDLREPGLENALARKLKASNLAYENLLISTDSDVSRQILRSLNPKLPLAHRFRMDHQAELTAKLLLGLDTDAVVWPSQMISRNLCRLLKAKGIMVYASGVNLAHEMRRLTAECGIDGISTRYPDLLITLREDRAA